MQKTKFEGLVEEVRALSPTEQGRLRDLIDSWLNPSLRPPSEEELEQELLREGVLDYVPPPGSDLADDDDWEPIEIKGKPISETIIEERR